MFLRDASPAHYLFQEHKHQIAADFKKPLTNPEEEWELLWSLNAMESLKQKGPYVKLSRWCSWEESMHFHLPEITAWKMLFSWYIVEIKGRPLEEEPLDLEEDEDVKVQEILGSV